MGVETPGEPAAGGKTRRLVLDELLHRGFPTALVMMRCDITGRKAVIFNERVCVNVAVWEDKFTHGLLAHLSGDKLGAVDELREVGVGLVGQAQARQGPLLRVHLPPDLHVDHLHLLAVLQSLRGGATARSGFNHTHTHLLPTSRCSGLSQSTRVMGNFAGRYIVPEIIDIIDISLPTLF